MRTAVASPDGPSSPPPSPRSEGAAGGRILVVEDDPMQATFVRLVLEASAYEVRTCDDPGRFAGEVADLSPDLVLMDVNLPGATGYELVRSLRRMPGAAALPVLFLTTEGQMSARLESAMSGGDEHLVKPLSAAALVAAVGERLDRNRRARQLVARDPVTQALSEPALVELARAAVAVQQRDPGHRSSWAAIELDHLWSIHECYGQATANRVLAAAAALVRRRLQPGDCLGRCDASGLALLIDRIRPRQVVGLLDEMRLKFAAIAHRTPAGGEFRTTLSAGVGVLRPGMSVEQWREAAARALRVARAAGRNRIEL